MAFRRPLREPEGERLGDLDARDDASEDRSEREPPPPLSQRPMVRLGVFAWSVIGVLVLAAACLVVLGRLTTVVVPLVIALFPAAVLMPPTRYLKARGMRDGLAAIIVLVGGVGVLVALFTLLTPQVAGELQGVGEKVQVGYERIRAYLLSGPLGLEPVALDEILARFQERLTAGGDDLGRRILDAGVRLVEGVVGLLLCLVALFFYLKDGGRIAGWLRDLWPARFRSDLQACGERVWLTIGAYIRGLLVIGLVDAVLIGLGLWALRIPLALPLAVLVFFGALFPIVGAFLAGTVAVLVALATNGFPAAVAVLVLIVVVQQLEGHILTPVLLGRATAMHPLAVIAALTAGGLLAGVYGAFLAVPLAASGARVVGYLRGRVPD